MSRRTSPSGGPTRHDESLVKPVLNPNEARFYRCVERLSHGGCRIMVKARLVDFMAVKGSFAVENFADAGTKKIDLLLCRSEDWLPMIGVELYDASLESQHLSSRDSFVYAYMKEAGIPLVRVELRELDDAEILRKVLGDAWARRERHLGASGSSLSPSSTTQQRQQRSVLSFVPGPSPKVENPSASLEFKDVEHAGMAKSPEQAPLVELELVGA